MNDPTQQAAFRLPLSLLERLDRYAERLGAEQPGVTISRADVVRLLLTRALNEESRSATGLAHSPLLERLTAPPPLLGDASLDAITKRHRAKKAARRKNGRA